MNIVLNGKNFELLSNEVSIASLLEVRGLVGKRIAVEVNEEIIPRSEYNQYQLCEGDQVEIVGAVGGG